MSDYDSDTSITDRIPASSSSASESGPLSDPDPSTSTSTSKSKSSVNNHQLGQSKSKSEPKPEVHDGIDKVKEFFEYKYNKLFAKDGEKFTPQHRRHKSSKNIQRIRIRREFVPIKELDKALKKVKKLKRVLKNSYENQKEDAKIINEDSGKVPTVLKMNNSTQRHKEFGAFHSPQPSSIPPNGNSTSSCSFPSNSNSSTTSTSKSKSNLENETFGPKLNHCECPCFCGNKLDETTRIANLYHLNFVKRPK